MPNGTVDRYSEDKGFGYIVRDGGKMIRVDRDSIDMEGYKTLNPGDRVVFEVEKTAMGAVATKVRKS